MSARRPVRPAPLGVVLLIGVAALQVGGPAPFGRSSPGSSAPTDAPRYGRDIRPLLSDRCFRCHGPDPSERRADLRLDTFEEAVRQRYGAPAIVPGRPEESELWRRVVHDDPDERMPPAGSHKAALDPHELDLVRRWIEAGAEYEPHWAFVPPVRPEVPKSRPTPSSSGAIDAFLEAALAAHDLRPNPRAERDALLRRVHLALTGLPPTLSELDAFLADEAPDAYARVVERLLTEEPYVSRFAEHFAARWLDAARYADTSGIHTDAGRQMWAWRDWVLEALRDGMPFDRFLTEQMAGDLLPNATRDQVVASGFHRNHVTTDEGGAIPEEYLVEYAVDRASTTGTVFLGLTLGCARCHDHKFDPIAQDEFYSFYAYFNSVDEPGLYSQLPDPERAFEPALELPSDAQSAELAGLESRLEGAQAELAAPIPGEEEERTAFLDQALADTGLEWVPTHLSGFASANGATLTAEEDGSVRATGPNPANDVHRFELETPAGDLRLLCLEALPMDVREGGTPEEGSPEEGTLQPAAQRVGRAANGNAVLGAVRVHAVSLADPTQRQAVELRWAWADVEQADGDYRVVNALTDDDGGLGWAVAGHQEEGGRVALFLADTPFGFEGGTRVEVELDYDSIYAQHVLGRVRLHLARLDEPGLATLPVTSSGWYATAPFPPNADADTSVFETRFGPEDISDLDLERSFDGLSFNAVPTFRDGRLNTELGAGPSATYVAKRLFVPSAREVEVRLGSDDGFRLFLDGREVAAREVDRGLAYDQDRVVLPLDAGEHVVLLKVVNTGGPGGYAWEPQRSGVELRGALLAALLPAHVRDPARDQQLRRAWLEELSPTHAARMREIEALEEQLVELRAEVPRTMVMRELPEPRPTFVLDRGLYDQPDPDRPVERGVPAALGALPADAPADRRGLARWLTDASNPLVARVAVNRLWGFVFGTGLVATSDDFGLQGAWPSHPELLDWLAVEYRESGWDTRALLRRLVLSDAFQRSTRRTPESARLDPDNRLLAHFPRRRLSAEQIRDQALFASGLLVESFGGASVKPLQPEGLWREVAMPASNTRTFEPGEGDDLWRRSVYTYWKRACPPPSMRVFDAPTREFCTVQREETASPLQALVLWNDPTFVEAARALAARTLAEPDSDAQVDAPTGPSRDARRLERMLRRCTGRAPEARELAALQSALGEFRARYAGDVKAAQALLASVRMDTPPVPDEDAPELAAWTLIASALLSLDAALTQG